MNYSNSFIFVPANKSKFLNKSLNWHVGGIIYDLEDSVLPNEKESALHQLADFLRQNEVKSPIAIRFNKENFANEFNYLMQHNVKIDYIVFPKYECLNSYHLMEGLIEHTNQNIKIIYCIESAFGLFNIREIIFKNDYGFGVLFGSSDFASSMNALIDSKMVWKAKLEINLACVANDLNMIDAPEFDIKNIEKLKNTLAFNVANGINYKATIHPDHLPVIQSYYNISETEYLRAKKIIELTDLNGVAVFENQMIDEAMKKKAVKTIKTYLLQNK